MMMMMIVVVRTKIGNANPSNMALLDCDGWYCPHTLRPHGHFGRPSKGA